MEPIPSESISTMETTTENDKTVTTTKSIETTSKKDEQTAAATEMMTGQETGSEPETASDQETEIGTESAEESMEPETGAEAEAGAGAGTGTGAGAGAGAETGTELLEYSASGKGAVGKITVTIWVQDGVLVDCEIDASKESEDKGQVVATEYQAAIMSGTMVDDLDSVSGASMSSATIKKLLRKCFEEAGIEH